MTMGGICNMKRIHYRLLAISMCAVLLLLSLPAFAADAPRYENSGMEFMDETEAGISLYNQEKNSLPKKPDGSAPDQYKLIQNTKLYINYRVWKDRLILPVIFNLLTIMRKKSQNLNLFLQVV